MCVCVCVCVCACLVIVCMYDNAKACSSSYGPCEIKNLSLYHFDYLNSVTASCIYVFPVRIQGNGFKITFFFFFFFFRFVDLGKIFRAC